MKGTGIDIHQYRAYIEVLGGFCLELLQSIFFSHTIKKGYKPESTNLLNKNR